MEQLLKKNDVCALLQVPKSTLDYWMYTGVIPYIRVGHRSVRFSKSRIEQWLKERENMPVGGGRSEAEEVIDEASH